MMMDKAGYIKSIFYLAAMRGLCKTQTDFANLLGVDRGGLCSAMNGSEKNLTDSLIKKVEQFAKDYRLEEDEDIPTDEQQGDLVKVMHNLSETIRLQAQAINLLEKMLEMKLGE